jgi:hypothetical protein
MNDYCKSSVLGEVRTAVIRATDANQPMLGIRWTNKGKDAEDPLYKATITIAPTGGTGSKLRVTLKQYEQSPSTGAVTVRTTSNFDGATYTTLGSLITAINAIEGFKAYRLNAAADYSLDSDDFIALAETAIRPLVLQSVLYRDASEFSGAAANWAVRIGVPEAFDGGRIKLLYVKGLVNSTTDCTIRISTDPSETDATQEVLRFTRAVPDNAQTDLYDFNLNPPVIKGPVLVELVSTGGITAGEAELIVTWQNAEV